MHPLDHVKGFVAGWRFPVILITVIGSTVLLMGAVLLIPPSAGAAYAFAEDFKILCFGYDPATGSMEWAYVWMFLVQPLLLASLVYLVWRGPIAEVWRSHRRRLLRTGAAAAAVVVLAGATVPGILQPVSGNPEAFPGERIRTAVPAAPFTLTNQESRSVSLEAFRGRVVVVTAVYATCHDTCPLILQQIKSAVSKLTDAERNDLTVLSISLDPETDTPAMMAMVAGAHGLDAPLYQALTGEPAYVNQVLDQYGFRRWRRPDGLIEHANLIHVLDRSGVIAYRLALGDVQEAWLTEALRQLIAESPSPA